MVALRLGVLFCAILALVTLQQPLAFGQAEVNKWSELGTWSGTQDSPCGGTVHIDSTIHSVITQRIDANGGFHYTFTINLHGFSAYDDFGNEYSGSQNFSQSFNCGPGCEIPQESTYEYNLRAISHGSAPNLLVKERVHFTINADGRPTATVDWDAVECRPKD